MSAHPFDDATALVALEKGRYAGATSPAYANMVGPFGGITAATALKAVLLHPALLGEPVALTVNFCAALADGAFEVTATPVRTNRSTQHWVIDMRQGEGVVLTATAVTATRRDTWGVDDAPMPVVPAPEWVAAPSLAPPVAWLQRYELRFIEGAIPALWDGSGEASRTQLWKRDAPARALDFCSLTALADVYFPRVWLRRATRVPVGTVSMTVYFHAGSRQLADHGSGWVLGQAQAQAFRNGFFDQTAQLWNAAGQMLASTHQVVYYKA
jgi:acyl-CoA thioesterase